MKKLIWSKTYETGFEIIDFQHKILVDKINEIIDCYEKNVSQEQLFSLFVFLEEYFVYHFNTEELFFRSFQYPKLKDHIAEHNYFMDRIKKIKEKYDKNSGIINEELIKFLTDWLLEHVLEMDKKFAESLLKQMELRELPQNEENKKIK